MLHDIGLARNHRFLRHPDHHGLDGIRHGWNTAGPHNHVASARINFVVERKCNRKWSKGLVKIAIERDYLLDTRLVLPGMIITSSPLRMTPEATVPQ